MSDQNNQLSTQASQSVIDMAKVDSNQWFNRDSWSIMQVVAQTFLASGAMPSSMDSAQKIIVALQAGKEAGLKPLESINSYYFVNGKISMYGEMAISQVLRCGHKIEWGHCDENSATIKITRGDTGASSSVTFTMKQAVDKGLTTDSQKRVKTPWLKFPENMLRFKAFHSCARFLVPDALHGVPIKEVEEGEHIEVAEEKKETLSAPAKISSAANSEMSMEEAINKPDSITKDQIAKIEKLIVSKKRNKEQLLSYYEVKSLDDLTKEQADGAISILTKAPDIVVEEMPVEEKPKRSKAAKYMNNGLKKNDEDESKSWPGDVCRYLRFVDGIQDADLPKDIIVLKNDAMSGEWKGYDYYPSLKKQIEMIPLDFE